MERIVHLYGESSGVGEFGPVNRQLEGRQRFVEYGGIQLGCLNSNEMRLSEFAFSLEELAAYLETQERCYFEWDGSFMWTGEAAGESWQMCGMAYDVAGKLQRIELRGKCPYSVIAGLLNFLKQGSNDVVAHLPMLGEYITERELERLWHA